MIGTLGASATVPGAITVFFALPQPAPVCARCRFPWPVLMDPGERCPNCKHDAGTEMAPAGQRLLCDYLNWDMIPARLAFPGFRYAGEPSRKVRRQRRRQVWLKFPRECVAALWP